MGKIYDNNINSKSTSKVIRWYATVTTQFVCSGQPESVNKLCSNGSRPSYYFTIAISIHIGIGSNLTLTLTQLIALTSLAASSDVEHAPHSPSVAKIVIVI